MGFGVRNTRGFVLTWPISSSVTLGNLRELFAPQFPYLRCGITTVPTSLSLMGIKSFPHYEMGFAYGTLIQAEVPGGPIQRASQRGVVQPPEWIRKESGFPLAFLSNVKGNPLLSPQLCFLTSCFLCPLRVLRPSCGSSRTPAAPQSPAKVSSHFCPLPPPLRCCHGNELPLSSCACFLMASPRI